ncbi:MAG: hypothetical protein JRE72_12325 [Deltaproteobacteria bacterium]|jgi:hypothetical protein|nr:hypothetical protein [Deltaproteobacteria bacterium]
MSIYNGFQYVKKSKKWQKARSMAADMVARHRTRRIGHDMLQLTEKNLN